MWLNMQLSGLPRLGRVFAWLAGLPLGPYKNKWLLARIKPYISPKAQIACPDFRLSRGCFIDDFVTVYSSKSGGSVVLDESVHIHRGTIIEVGRGAQVTIGKGTHIQSNCNLNGHLGNVRIGCYVMVGPQCGFFPYQHRMDDLSEPMCKQELFSKGDIVIEDDVWFGAGVKVMDGVRVGRGAVVGANAVVTHDIPPYCIVVGVPARIIGKREGETSQDVI